MNISGIDVAIIVVYMSVLIYIGIHYKRKASNSIEDYFLGGRSLPWWILGLSGMAAWLDMTGTMLITSFLYLLGPRGLYVEFRGGAGLMLIFLMLWVGKWHRRSNCITGAEWMKYRFGGGFWGDFARLASAISMVTLFVGVLAYSFKGAGLFLSMFLPFSPMICALGMLLITAMYALSAGFYGVVIADIFQSVCIILGTACVVVFAVLKVSDYNSLNEMAKVVTGNSGWMATLPQWHTEMPKGYENYSFLGMITIFYLVKVLIQGAGSGMDPKYFGARNDRECGLIGFTSGWFLMIRWPLMLGFAVLGLYLVNDLFPDQIVLEQAATLIKSNIGEVSRAQWPEVTGAIMNSPSSYSNELISGLQSLLGDDWVRKISLVSFDGTVNPERILPAVLLFNFPVGLQGLILVTLIAAAISTFSSLINASSAYLTRDIYQGYMHPNASTKELVFSGYVSGLIIIVAGIALAYSSDSINEIWGWISMGLVGGMMVPTVLRLYWWRFNSGGFAIGTMVGLVAAILQRVFFKSMPEVQQFVFIGSIGLVASIIGTYITKPTDKEVLINFYRTTRPFGFWKPLEKSLDNNTFLEMKQEHKYDLISLPFAFFWLVTLLLIPMQLLIRAYADMFYTVPIFIASMIGLYFFWFKKLPKASKNDELLNNAK